MRVFLCLVISVLIFGKIQAQKVKYKKGTISVDKVEKYEVVKTKKKGIGEPRLFTLKTVDGVTLLSIKDSMLVYTKLPHETRPRVYQHVQYINAPELSMETLVPQIGALNFGKKLSKDLEKIGFFKAGELTKDIYEEYIGSHNADQIPGAIKYVDSMNVVRKDNYDRTVQMFGQLKQRTPGRLAVKDGKISEGLVSAGQFKKGERGSYAKVYQVIDISGNVIGKFVDIPSEGRANIQMLINAEDKDKRLSWVYFKSTPKQPKWSMDQKMAKAAEYMISNGFL